VARILSSLRLKLTRGKFKAEWGFVYAGRVLVSAVDENGKFQLDVLEYGDIWYSHLGPDLFTSLLTNI